MRKRKRGRNGECYERGNGCEMKGKEREKKRRGEKEF